MRGVLKYSSEEPDRVYAERKGIPGKSGRMRHDWGIYEDPGQLTKGIYSVSDLAGVGVYHDGTDDPVGDDRGDDNVYGFNGRTSSRFAASQWSSTHSLAQDSSPTRASLSATTPGAHRGSLGDSHRRTQSSSYSRDSYKTPDSSRHHISRSGQVEPLYRSVDKRTSDRGLSSSSSTSTRSQQQPQSRSYSSGSRDYSSSGYRSLRSYTHSSDAYDDREPRSLDDTIVSNGYSNRLSPDYSPQRHSNVKRSSSRDYLSSDLYATRRSYPSSETTTGRGTVTKGILTNTGKYGGGSRSALSNSTYSASRSALSNSHYNGDTRSGVLYDDGDTRNNLSSSNTLDRRTGSSSYASRSSLLSTVNKGSQTELSAIDDLPPPTDSKSRSSLQVPEGGGSDRSRRSSSSIQQVVSFSLDGNHLDSKSERKYDSLSRRNTTSGILGDTETGERNNRKNNYNRRNTKDEQSQTDDVMSQWGRQNGGMNQWGQGHNSEMYDDHGHGGHGGPPLPRPPMPPQHYPGHDSHTPTSGPMHPPPQNVSQLHNHAYHNHAYHSHGHNHARHPSHQSSGSRQPLVHAQSTEGRKCRECMTRVPYATLIATVMCCVGVGVFCGTMYRGTTLTLRMFEEVFKLHIKWDREYRVEPVQLTFMVVGAGMGGLGLMILFVGCLSTGDTRNKVYRTWRGRVGGRISCAIFMGITYLLSLAWLLMFAALIVVTLFYTLAWFQCQYVPPNDCIDYNQFSFLFPPDTPEQDKSVCVGERKLFCKDYVNNAEIMFILASVSAFLVILSLVHYLMCLAANYAHIKDQEKFMDLQEIQFLQESEMSTLPKDRF